jgi:prepilin-type N-terminal cleavage/methylation domain-containing protein
MKRFSRGFTLIELLVVIAIIGSAGGDALASPGTG